MDPELKHELSASKMRMRAKSPYFAVLASYLKPIQATETSFCDTVATNSRYLLINRDFWLALKPLERDFVLIHEVLHAALGHCTRCGRRNPVRWNYAGDYVVNIIAKDAGYQMPAQGLHDEQYRGMSVDEVYALLPQICNGGDFYLAGDIRPSEGGEAGAADVEKTWRIAKAQAKAASKLFGSDPLGDPLSVELERSTVDWRAVVWRSLTLGGADFIEWDRRLLHDECYVEAMEPRERPSPAAICVDTSGSTMSVLGKFCGEVQQIASLYGSENLTLYFADCELIGPLPVSEISTPRGGGGTSFVPFFEEVEKRRIKTAVYLTDLDGSFPEKPPNCDVVWVLPPGVREKAPFGRFVKILD